MKTAWTKGQMYLHIMEIVNVLVPVPICALLCICHIVYIYAQPE